VPRCSSCRRPRLSPSPPAAPRGGSRAVKKHATAVTRISHPIGPRISTALSTRFRHLLVPRFAKRRRAEYVVISGFSVMANGFVRAAGTPLTSSGSKTSTCRSSYGY
jgi:hypothetical protein